MIKGFLKLTALSVFLMGCESDADRQRKPALVDEIMSASMENCDLQTSFNQTADYEERLREALMGAKADSLDFIIDNEITICLDQRLSSREEGFFDRTPYALYYPDQNILTLYDNGDSSNTAGIFTTVAGSYSDDLIDRFAYEYSNVSPQDIEHIQFGGSHTQMVGKVSTRVYRWYDNAETYTAIERNSNLLDPPTR